MNYETNLKLSLKEKVRLKMLRDDFFNLPEDFDIEEGIISAELKVVSNNFEAHKVKIAQFYYEDGKTTCKVVEGYALTDANQRVLYLTPSVGSKFILKNKITDLEMLDHAFAEVDVIGKLTKEQKADYDILKKYVDGLTQDKGTERI